VSIDCSFCDGRSLATRQVVAGPKVFICRRCIQECAAGASESAGTQRLRAQGLRCSFCNRSSGPDTPLHAARGHYICTECIEACVDIFADGRIMR
jgi:ATP-dependent protease Clp ATPase subunit